MSPAFVKASRRSGGLQYWKIIPVVKGLLTWIPLLNAWRLRHPNVDGSESARYCYSVWLRHLTTLAGYGFSIKGAKIGELGPGDSLGVGLAALLSGASRYVGLDLLPYAAKADLPKILSELGQMYADRTPIPDHNEFPLVWPKLDSYGFPQKLLEGASVRMGDIRRELGSWTHGGQFMSYQAPWTSLQDVDAGSLDLILSQAVLEHVDNLEETYKAMHAWLRPGGYASHVIGFVCHHLARDWNGHWAYSDLEWRMVRGTREFLINREPLSTHLAWAKKVGFEILLVNREYDNTGLEVTAFSPRFRTMDREDARTSSVMLILRKLRDN